MEQGRARHLKESSELPAANAIVGRFFGHHHVVWVALAQARAGHTDEAGACLERLNILRADVAHRLAQTANELINNVGERTLVGHASLDALGDQAAIPR